LKLRLMSMQSFQTDPYVWKEPLDSFFEHTLASLFTRLGQPPELAIALLSVIAGIVYVKAILLIAQRLGHNLNSRLALTLSLLALGSSHLWFGHVENYSLVTAFTLLSIALAIGYLQGQTKLWLVGLFAGVSVSFHPQALFAIPALVIMLDQRRLHHGLILF